MNAGKSVQKANSDEMALIQNAISLLNELAGEESAENETQGAVDQGAQMAMKADEAGRQEGADVVTNPAAGNVKDKGMAPWDSEDEEVKKAWGVVAKAIQASDTEGVVANDPGDKRAEEIPDPDEENVKEVAKALALLRKASGMKKTVAKSQVNPEIAELMTVIKSMADRQARTDAILGEVLEGMGVAKSLEAAAPAAQGVSTSVQKAQGNAPYAGYDAGNMGEIIAMSVAKALEASGKFQQSNSGIPVAKGFGEVYGHEDAKAFTQGIVELAADKWGTHTLPAQQ